MKSGIHERIDDYGAALQERITTRLGGELLVTATPRLNDEPIYAESRVYGRIPGSLAVPVQANTALLARQVGRVFGVMAAGGLYPAVVTDRSDAHQTVLARLNTPADRLDLKNLSRQSDTGRSSTESPALLTMLQMSLLKQAAALQAVETGTKGYDNIAPGRELGHTVLGLSALVKPDVLSSGHAVHAWADSPEGVGGIVTARQGDLQLFDLQTDRGIIPLGYEMHPMTSGFVLDIPGLRIDETVSAVDRFTLGLGVVALEGRRRDGHSSVIGGGSVASSVVDTLECL